MHTQEKRGDFSDLGVGAADTAESWFGLAWCTGKGFNGVSGCGKVQGKAAGYRSGVVTGPRLLGDVWGLFGRVHWTAACIVV